MMLFSLAKQLRTVTITTFANTIANVVKKEASCPPKLRQSVINLGQTGHKITTRMERCVYDFAKDTPIQSLDEKKAIQAGSLLLAELSLYTAVGVTVVLGVHSHVSALRKERLKGELEAIVMELAELRTQKHFELHGGKRLQLHSQKKVELAPNQDELEQMLDELRELVKGAYILLTLDTLLDLLEKPKSN